MSTTTLNPKTYTKAQLETFGLDELKAICANYSKLLDLDQSPPKYKNRRSSWVWAIEFAQESWEERQPQQLSLDLAAAEQPETETVEKKNENLLPERAEATGSGTSERQSEESTSAPASASSEQSQDSGVEPEILLLDGVGNSDIETTEPDVIQCDRTNLKLRFQQLLEQLDYQQLSELCWQQKIKIPNDFYGPDIRGRLMELIYKPSLREAIEAIATTQEQPKPEEQPTPPHNDDDDDDDEPIRFAAGEEPKSFIPSPLFPLPAPPAEEPEDEGDDKVPEETLDAFEANKTEGESAEDLAGNEFFRRTNLNKAMSGRFSVGDRILAYEGVAGEGVAGEIVRQADGYWIVRWEKTGQEWYYTSEDFSQLGCRRAPLRLNPDRVPPYFGERTHKADDSGQLSLFELEEEEEEAPDPDDFPSRESYLIAWDEWEAANNSKIPSFSSAPADKPRQKAALPVEQTKGWSAPLLGAISREEAAEALGIECDRILKDPRSLWNCVVVVYLDAKGKKRSQFVSYRKFRRWWESFAEATNIPSETLTPIVRRELQRYGEHCPFDLLEVLESFLQPQPQEQEETRHREEAIALSR